MIDAKDLTWTEIEMRLRAHMYGIADAVQVPSTEWVGTKYIAKHDRIDLPGVGVVGHSMPVERCDACRNAHHANCTGFLVNGDLCGCECRK